MEISLLVIGKTTMSFVSEGEAKFYKRISNYAKFSCKVLDSKVKSGSKTSGNYVKSEEGKLILAHIKPSDYLVLLDEKGSAYSSRAFAKWISTQMNKSRKKCVFVVGGAFGFDESVYQRANHKISLSEMTFSHQLIRVIFAEQLYRAFSILRNEKYHND